MYFKTKSQTIYYEIHGNSNKYMLILPGWGNTRETFNYIINTFKDEYTIYIIDYPGFGKSPLPNKELTIYDYAHIINLFIKEKEIINPLIIAHSFGGRITSILLSKYKLKVDKIILIDVAGIKRRKKLKVFLKEKLYKLLKSLVIFLPPIKKEIYLNKLLLIFGSKDYQEIPPIMRKTFQNIIKEDLTKYYKEITSETLILWGEKDNDTPLQDAKLIEKLTINSALIIFKNAGHFSYLEYPLLTNNIIKEFTKHK